MLHRAVAVVVASLSLTGFCLGQSNPWHELTVYAFESGIDGTYPQGGLTPTGDGFIGETFEGGAYGTGNGNTGYGTIFLLSAPPQPGGTWTKTTVYNFTGESDGGAPGGGLLAGPGGSFFGTTAANGGTLFQLNPQTGSGNWSLTTIYTFPPSLEGTAPEGRLISDASGNLYGVTGNGGVSSAGSVYELSPPSESGGPWIETTLYSFSGGADGKEPFAGLLADKKGRLYGTTIFGGVGGLGTVWRLIPPSHAGEPWSFTTLWSFLGAPSDGAEPLGPLLFDQEGNIYGTTNAGGAFSTYGYGTAFELSPTDSGMGPWKETILHNFQGTPPDGAYPGAGLIWGKNGVLYGTTQTGFPGCGVVFSLSPPPGEGPWTETILYSFPASGGRGTRSMTNLVLSPGGGLYGTTYAGGPVVSAGVVFQVYQ